MATQVRVRIRVWDRVSLGQNDGRPDNRYATRIRIKVGCRPGFIKLRSRKVRRRHEACRVERILHDGRDEAMLLYNICGGLNRVCPCVCVYTSVLKPMGHVC